MDANEYACKVKPPDKSLALLLNSAQWIGQGQGPLVPVPDSGLQTRHGDGAPAPSSSLAASVSGPSSVAQATADKGQAAKEEKPLEPVSEPTPGLLTTVPLTSTAQPAPEVPTLEAREGFHFLRIEGREYRIGGLEQTLDAEALKVVLRLRHGEAFHLDTLDLCRDLERRRFIERAEEETGLRAELLKRDMGKLLLAVEQAQVELLKPQEPAASKVTLTPEEREEALAWLRAPNLIERLREVFRKSGIIGEETNTLVAYLAGVSRKLTRPLAIIIQSASAAGKTTLMDAVLSFFPEEDRVKYSAMTGQSLYYLGQTSLKHKILAVVEEAGAEKASYALKLLQSEGELTIASTGKDPQTGKMVTQEYHVEGPVMIFLTTTAIDLDEELQNRCLTLAVDETPEQTARIHQTQRQRRTLAGLVAREERKAILEQLRNAQRLLQPLEILNPYAPELTFATGRTRNRRDHEKYLTLIDAIALLHQHQRPRVMHPIQGRVMECIEVTLGDIALANQLAPEVLARSLDELPPQTRALLGHIREVLRKKAGPAAKLAGSKSLGPGSAWFSRKELREASGWSLTQVSVHLERLVALEYIALRHGRMGSQFIYEALFDPAIPESIAHIGLIDVEALGRTHRYEGRVSGFSRGVSGESPPVTGGVQTGPTPCAALEGNALETRCRGNGIAHLEPVASTPAS